MSPLIGRACKVSNGDGTWISVDGKSAWRDHTYRPAVIMDVALAKPTRYENMQTGEKSIEHGFVLLVLFEGGTLQCVYHHQVIVE